MRNPRRGQDRHPIPTGCVEIDGIRVPTREYDALHIGICREDLLRNGRFVHREDVIGFTRGTRELADADLTVHLRIDLRVGDPAQGVDGDVGDLNDEDPGAHQCCSTQ